MNLERLQAVKVTLGIAEWRMVLTALSLKVYRLRDGQYDPEDEAGENARWIRHLRAIEQKIDEALTTDPSPVVLILADVEEVSAALSSAVHAIREARVDSASLDADELDRIAAVLDA